MAPPKGPRKILRAAAPPERARVPGVAVPDAAPDRRDAGIQRVEDRVLQPLPRRPREDPLHGVHAANLPGQRPGSPVPGALRWRREDNITLPEKMETLVLSQTLDIIF